MWYNRRYTEVVKTAISLPDELYTKATETADRMGIARSQLFARAVAEYIRTHGDDSITERIDAVLVSSNTALDSAIERMQRATIAGQSHDETW